jgi:hypothetical protein
MSDFEFISIILSIVVGLGITRVLSGLSSVIEHRNELRVSWLPLGWAIGVLLWQVAFWLGTVNSTRHRPEWTVATFGVLLFLAVGLYFVSALVLPGRIDSTTDLSEHFEHVRKPFFSVYAAWSVVGSMLGGWDNFVALGPPYWIGQTVGVLAGLLGVATPSRRVHVGILVLHLAALLGLIVVRFYVV